MPAIRLQNERRRAALAGESAAAVRVTGALSPGFPGFARLYDALPAALSPPSGFLPSLRCQAGLFCVMQKGYQTRGALLLIVETAFLFTVGIRFIGLYIVSCITAYAPAAAITRSS